MKNSTDVGVGAPHCNVYAKAIPLEDALEDSPMFRKKLKDREAEVEEFASGIKKIIKSSKNYLSAANAYAESFKDFITEIANFKNRMDVNDETLDTGFMHFISGLRDIATFQEFLGSQMEGLISAPLQEFVNTDVKQVKQSYKQYEKSISNLDSVVSKLGQVKKKNADKLSELSADVEEAKRAHRGACLDVTLGFNKVLAKKRFEFLERVCVYIQAQSTFFHQGYQFFTDNEPKIKDYSFYLQSTRKKFEDDTKDFESQKAHLIDENPLQRVASPSMPHILMRGYLFKRSDDVININTWIRRYFVLKEGHLCYYKTGNEEQPDLNLNLLLCSVKLRPDMERRNCFEIVSPPDRSLILQAESDELMNQWISEIQKSISNSLNAQPTPSSEERKKQNSKLHLDEGEKETPLARLRALSPANCVCADCDSKDPDWASFNLGVLLCIDCSGVHRSLGVHISKVRSLSLDQWEPDLMEMMCGLGNEFVNSIYEANIPEDRTKPASTDSRESVNRKLSSRGTIRKSDLLANETAVESLREMKNKWIRDKYEKKLFVKGFVPSVENADENAIKEEKCKLLFNAIKAGDIKKVFELIVQGVDLSYQNPEDEMHSPAHAAIAVNSPAILILMLMNNAVPDLKDAKGWTPLHLAADKGLANCAVLLLQKNTIHALAMTDNEGLTPLQIAMKVGSADCVTLLRLAQLARDEGATALEESFADALRQFSRDTRAK